MEETQIIIITMPNFVTQYIYIYIYILASFNKFSCQVYNPESG
jgi:hypothetical protein